MGMDKDMVIEELRKELRHLKGRRDFYMKEVKRLKDEHDKLRAHCIQQGSELSEVRLELLKAKEVHGGSQV